MSKSKKYDELVDFIENYKEDVKSLGTTSFKEDEFFKRGELVAIRSILRKIDKLEKTNPIKSSLWFGIYRKEDTLCTINWFMN